MDVGAFQLGEWSVEPAHGRLSRAAVVVHLEPRVMDLLSFFASRRGEVLSKSEILDHVWDHQVVSESALTRAVTKLRNALGDTAAESRHIQTIPRRGYCLVASVTFSEAAPDTATWILRWGERSVPLPFGSLEIGRSPEADLQLPATRASRRHARIDATNDGVILNDLGSKNGSFVNGRRVEQPTPLFSGDEIGIGGETLTLHNLLDAPTETDHRG